MDTMKYWTCLTTLMLFFGMQNQMEAYQECEELEKCTLMHNVYGNLNANTFYTWRINITQVGACNTEGCSTYRNFEDLVTVKIKKDKNYVSFIVEFSNVTRQLMEHFGNNWNLVDTLFNVIFETTLLFIVKPKQLNCTYNASTEGLFIACVGSRSFPQSLCNVSLNYNGNKSSELLPPKYHHSKVSNEPVYYVTTCSTMIKASSVTTGLYEFHVVIYPDAKTKQCDACGNMTLKVNIENPAIELFNCSTLVVEGTKLDCTCGRTDRSDIATRIVWYQGNTSVQQDNDMSVLTSKVASQAQDYTCEAVSDLGWSINKTYTPDIFYQNYLNESRCPNERPYLCLPSGDCYGNDAFCSGGKVVSCFPLDIEEGELSSWCETTGQFNVSRMRNRACHMACASRFGSVISKQQSAISNNDSWLTAVVVLAIMFILSLGLILWMLFGKIRQLRWTRFSLLPHIFRNVCTFNSNQTPARIAWDACENNWKHEELISCSVYRRDPNRYLNLDNLSQVAIERIQKYIDFYLILTVKLVVRNKSQYLNSDSNYNISGSGLIVKVKYTDLACNCQNVQPHRRWCVYISTSTQVVSNEEEAKSTTAELFYEDENKTRVKELHGVGLYQFTKNESSIIQCVSCDKDVCTQLKSALNKLKKVVKTINYVHNTVVVISHPHGRSKHMSIGTYTETETIDDSIFTLSRLSYNTPSCAGMEGAAVLILNDSFKQKFRKLIAADFIVHCGVNQVRKNCSSYASTDADSSNEPLQSVYVQSYDNHETNPQQDNFTVDLEANIDFGEDADNSAACDKDLDHHRFIPLGEFSFEKLEYQDQEVYNYIKTLADLTCKIDVAYTSSARPEFIEGTNSPYPVGNRKGTASIRSGTGVVVSVIKIKDGGVSSCPCPACNQSDWPFKKFYFVYVRTAKHIVFDDSEVVKSTIRLNFDNDLSSEMLISGGRIVESDMKIGTSLVQYITHDTRITQISENLRNLYRLEQTIKAHLKGKKDQSLAVIVSHLHGWPKHISTGHWLERELTISKSGTFVRYTYTTATCPGSSGAPVFIPGEGVQRVFKRLCLPHVHRETGKDGRGVSCLGVKSVVKRKSE